MESSVVTSAPEQLVKENIRGMKGWLKLLGIIQIVAGILQALSIFGILWAWLPIWLGVILNSAGTKAEEYATKGDPQALVAFTGKIKTYFIVNGIMMIISLAVLALALIVLTILAVLGVFSLPALFESLNQ